MCGFHVTCVHHVGWMRGLDKRGARVSIIPSNEARFIARKAGSPEEASWLKMRALVPA